MHSDRTATLVEAKFLAPHVRELTLQPDGDSFVGFTPGQWLSLRLPVGDRPPLVRAYSLGNAPRADGTLTICLDRIEGGLGSEYLYDVTPGTVLEFSCPLGNFTLPDGDGALLMVARFTGVVPFRAMIQALARGDAARRRTRLVHGAGSVGDLIYRDEFAALANGSDWFEYFPITAETGDECSVLADHAADWEPFVPMLSGIREFTFPTRAYLMETYGFDRKQIRVENYNGPTAR
jgi:ferredoxin-NADP reductase